RAVAGTREAWVSGSGTVVPAPERCRSATSARASGAAVAGGDAQAGGAQAADELAGVDLDGAELDEARDELGRHVVVVEVERARRELGACGEGVELVERGVADEVAPEPAVAGPHRGVDEHGHPSMQP